MASPWISNGQRKNLCAYKGEVFILQSRPETVWSQKETKPVMEPRKSALEHIVAGSSQEENQVNRSNDQP